MDVPAAPDRPTIDTDSESWWAAVQDRKLMVNTCAVVWAQLVVRAAVLPALLERGRRAGAG